MASKPQKKCLFFGGSGMSKEHIWSDWMGPLFHNHKDHFHFLTDIRVDSVDRVAILTPSIERRPGPMHKRKIRNVCDKCNNGWMSRIVDRAKSWVEPAILGRPVELNLAAQRAFAAWAALTAVMAEYTDPAYMGVQPADRQHLMTQGEAPASWTIALGHCGAPEWKPHRYRHHGGPIVGMRNGEAILTHHFQVSTIALGSLALVVNSATMPELVEEFRAGLSGRGVEVVWPSSKEQVRLPSTQVLGDEEMNFFADGFTSHIIRTLGN